MKSVLLKTWGVALLILICACFITCCSGNTSADDIIYVIRETPKPTATPIPTPPTETPSPTPLPTPTPAPTVAPTEKPCIVDPNKPMVALTFDDGPHYSATGHILDILERYNARATFFVVGNRIEGHEDLIIRAHKLNCEFGNHTFDHKTRMTGLSKASLYSLLDPVDQTLYSIAGIKTKLVRPPGGFYDKDTQKNLDRPILLWSVDTNDWRSRDKNAIFEHIKENVHNGAIVIMHDIYETTADACELTVPWLIENGYQLVTVSELFEANGIRLEPGKVYRKAEPAA